MKNNKSFLYNKDGTLIAWVTMRSDVVTPSYKVENNTSSDILLYMLPAIGWFGFILIVVSTIRLLFISSKH